MMQSKRVARINSEETTYVQKLVVKFDSTTPPHEGLFEVAPHVSDQILVWNTTVDGHVVRSGILPYFW